MLKKILICFALLLPMMAAAQTVKIGVVNINAVIDSLPDTRAAQERIQEAAGKYQAESQKLQEEFNRKYEEYNAQRETALPAIRQRMESELQEYSQKIQQFMQSADQDLAVLQQQLMMPVLQKVRDAINSVGREGGYSLIQNMDESILFYYAAPVEDVTPEVRRKLGM